MVNRFLESTEEKTNRFTDPLTVTKELINKTGIPNALKKTGNKFLDIIQYADAPRNALFQGFKEVPFGGQGDVVGEAKKGLLMETHGSTQEFIPKSFQAEHPVLSAIGGMVGDIATDPLTYAPSSIFTIPARAIGRAAKITKLINPVSRLANDSTLLRWLNVYVGDSKKAKEIAGQYKDYKNSVRYRGVEDAKLFNQEIEVLAEQMGVPVATLKADITKNVEQGASGVTEGMRNIETKLVQRNKEMLDLEQELGVKIGDLGPTYMAHILTPEGGRAVGANEIKEYFSLRPSTAHPSAEMRKLEGSVAEINAQRIYGTSELFYDDPVIIQGVRELRHAMVVGGKKYLDDVQTLGVPVEQAPEGYRSIKGITGVSFDPDVAEVIEHQFDIISDPGELDKALQAFDGAQRWWKMWSLGARPAYHFRNLVGNFWNSYLGGLKNPQRYQDAAQLQYMAETGKIEGQLVGKDAQELFAAARDHGVLGKGQYHADIPTEIAKDLPGGKDAKSFLAKAWKYTGSTDNPLLQAGFKFGGGVESNARLALFLDQVKKGASYEDAAKHVKKYLFDYEDLSPVERDVFKRVVPFYTWSRKNIPLQVEALATQPDRIQKINIVRNNIERGSDKPDQENVPEYIKQTGPVYIGKSKEEDVSRVFTLMNYLPLMDVGRIVAPSEFVNMMSPFMKAPLEYFTNYDRFRDQEIEQYKGQTTDFLGVRMPVHLAHVARNLIMLNEIDRANPGNVFGKSTYDAETETRTRTNSFGMGAEQTLTVPGIGLRKGSEEDKYLQIGDMKFGVGTPREERTDLSGSSRLLQYLFGFRLYNVNEGSNEIRNIRAFEGDIRKLKTLLSSAARQNKTREMEELSVALDQAANAFERKTTLIEHQEKKQPNNSFKILGQVDGG